MRPVFLLIGLDADTPDLTGDLLDRVVRLRVSDQEGTTSDRLEVSLDDRGTRIALPPIGARLRLLLGYLERPPLPVIGDYVVDEVSVSGPPATIAFCGKGADMTGSLKAPRTAHHEPGRLGELVRTLATRHRLEGLVHPSLAELRHGHLEQQAESDMGLLQRLAGQLDLTLKIDAARVLLRPHASRLAAVDPDAPTTYGLAPPRHRLSLTAASRYTWRASERSSFGRVHCHHYDTATGERRVAEVGRGHGPVLVLRHDADDEPSAREQARARLRQGRRQSATLSLDLPGDTRLLAGHRITIEDAADPVAGDWSIERCEHTLDGSGLRTRLECVLPDTEPD